MLLPGTLGNAWSETTDTFAPGAMVSWAETPVANSAATSGAVWSWVNSR